MDRILARLEGCYQLAEQHFDRHFPRPDIELDLRGQRAGVAYLNQNLLRFNGQMYRDNTDDFLLQTVPHEAAHLIAHQVFGPRIRPHGPQWQAIMTELFRLPANRCHNYAVSKRSGTRYLYRCACPDHMPFTPQRHAWVRKGRQYQCRRCGDLLYFTGRQQAATA